MWLYSISWAGANGMEGWPETWEEKDWRINDVGSRGGHVDCLSQTRNMKIIICYTNMHSERPPWGVSLYNQVDQVVLP